MGVNYINFRKHFFNNLIYPNVSFLVINHLFFCKTIRTKELKILKTLVFILKFFVKHSVIQKFLKKRRDHYDKRRNNNTIEKTN